MTVRCGALQAEHAALLGRMKDLRQQCFRALAAQPIGGREYRVAEAALASMDSLAEHLTGDPRFFTPASGSR